MFPLVFVCVLCLAPSLVWSQQSPPTVTSPATSDPQAVALIQKALNALTGGSSLTDVTVTGTLTVTKSGNFATSATAAGQAVSETGTITLVATSSGQGQTTTLTQLGSSKSVQNISPNTPTITVTGADGTSHTIQTATALTPHPGWFYPAILLASGLSSPYVASYVGHETWEGVGVEHITIWRTNGSGTSVSAMFQRAGQHDVYLNSASFLPLAITYISHPYNPNNPSAPFVPYRGNTPDRLTTVQFSDYQQDEGFLVPFHLQSSMTIVPWDATSDFVSTIQISSVTFNSGVAIATN